MKLLISFLSILSLGSAVNRHHHLRPSDAQLEKIQSRTLQDENNDDTCYSNMEVNEFDDINFDNIVRVCSDQTVENPSCSFNYGNATAVDHFASVCVNDLDGRVKTMNFILTGDACKDFYYDAYDVENVLLDPYDFLGRPKCIPNTCTEEEAITFYQIYANFTEIEGCDTDISFVVQDKSKKKAKNAKSMKGGKKQKSSPKNKKTKSAKSMKGSKKSKSN